MKHFSLVEFERSATAARKNISNKVTSAKHLAALDALVDAVLDPVREEFGLPVRITSGYRSDALNKAVGGSSTSQHSLGEAADIVIDGVPAGEVCERIVALGLVFDQLIYEWTEDQRGRRTYWTHVSHRVGRNRGQVLTGTRPYGKKTSYQKGIVK